MKPIYHSLTAMASRVQLTIPYHNNGCTRRHLLPFQRRSSEMYFHSCSNLFAPATDSLA